MTSQPALKYVFYIAATPEKVWDGFVSRESNRIIFGGAEFQVELTQLVGRLRGSGRDRMASL